MSGTGTSTGDFDDDQRGFVAEPDATVSADTVFTEAAAGTAVTGSDAGAADVAEQGRPDDD